MSKHIHVCRVITKIYCACKNLTLLVSVYIIKDTSFSHRSYTLYVSIVLARFTIETHSVCWTLRTVSRLRGILIYGIPFAERPSNGIYLGLPNPICDKLPSKGLVYIHCTFWDSPKSIRHKSTHIWRRVAGILTCNQHSHRILSNYAFWRKVISTKYLELFRFCAGVNGLIH